MQGQQFGALRFWILQQSRRILMQDKVEAFHQPHMINQTLNIFGQKLPTVDVEKPHAESADRMRNT